MWEDASDMREATKMLVCPNAKKHQNFSFSASSLNLEPISTKTQNSVLFIDTSEKPRNHFLSYFKTRVQNRCWVSILKQPLIIIIHDNNDIMSPDKVIKVTSFQQEILCHLSVTKSRYNRLPNCTSANDSSSKQNNKYYTFTYFKILSNIIQILMQFCEEMYLTLSCINYACVRILFNFFFIFWRHKKRWEKNFVEKKNVFFFF